MTLRERLKEVVHCRCLPDYTDRGMVDPQCFCDLRREEVENAARLALEYVREKKNIRVVTLHTLPHEVPVITVECIDAALKEVKGD